jgi:hypothetical protein
MKRTIVAAVLQLSAACAFAGSYLSGNDVLQMCQGIDTGQANATCTSWMAGFVTGDAIGEGSALARTKEIKSDWCTRPNVTVDQETRVIYRWLVDHPTVTDQMAAVLMHEALKESFPCPTGETNTPTM